MDTTTVFGSLGVALLLLAFVLNLLNRLSRDSAAYKIINMIGAGLAGYASWLLDFMPFVILEGIWCLAAAASLFRCGSASGRAGSEE